MKKSRVMIAVDKHNKGYNCCQAVICTYCDLLDIDEITAFKISEGLGFGISKTQGICGAVSAMVLAAGLKNSDGDINNPKTKRETYDLGYNLIKEFENMHGTSICKELKGKQIRSCNGCIMDCAKIIEEKVFKDEFES